MRRLRFSGPWRELYEEQRKEVRFVQSIQDKPLERASYVIRNAERLGGINTLKAKDQAKLIASPTRLFEAVDRMHRRERRVLSSVQKYETSVRINRVWEVYRYRLGQMTERQQGEREAMRAQQAEARQGQVSYLGARIQLETERDGKRDRRLAADAPHAHETDAGYTARIKQESKEFYLRSANPVTREWLNFVYAWTPEQQASRDAARPTPTVWHDFVRATGPKLNKSAEEIKAAQEEWLRKHGHKDFDREL